jgi:hypothetical protein
MQNSERWDFAQRYAAIEMMKTGTLTISAVLGYLYYPAKIAMLLGLALIAIVIILTFRVEK